VLKNWPGGTARTLFIWTTGRKRGGGAARGWRTILHETPEKTRAALEHFKLL